MNRSDGKIKVLHIVGKMHPGGIETLLMNAYRHIDRSKFEFHFGVQTEEKAFYDDEIVSLGGRIVRQPHPRQGLRAYRRALAANIREHGPYDAIHSHIFGFSGYVLKVARELKIPVRIGHSHNIQDSKGASWTRRLYRSYMRELLRRHATALLGCSGEACESLFGRDCWKDERVKVFPNAIDLSPYEDLPALKAKLRARLDLPEGATVIGHIGRFSPQKNHAFLLSAFAAYRRRDPGACLLLIGDGPYRSQVESMAAGHGLNGAVRFLGVRKDIPELLGAMDLFLLPSLYEGLGIVLIEAQAAGVPCLASDRVPQEADLGLGLMKRLPLEAVEAEWAAQIDRMTEGSGDERLAWPDRRRELARRGFDIGQSVRELERMYGG